MTHHEIKDQATNRVVKNWKTTVLSLAIVLVCGFLVYTEKVDFETGIIVGIPTLISGLVLKDKQIGL